eukprot:COSAG01_NODE_3755_length_5726_cov_2.726853_2_plen_53_part_00
MNCFQFRQGHTYIHTYIRRIVRRPDNGDQAAARREEWWEAAIARGRQLCTED